MKPRRTPTSNKVFELAGGTEDNHLWVRVAEEDGRAVITSVWELSSVERDLVVNGGNIELTVWGEGTPPVALRVTGEPLGRSGHG